MGRASHLRNRGASGGGAGNARGSARRLAGECVSFRVVTCKSNTYSTSSGFLQVGARRGRAEMAADPPCPRPAPEHLLAAD